ARHGEGAEPRGSGKAGTETAGRGPIGGYGEGAPSVPPSKVVPWHPLSPPTAPAPALPGRPPHLRGARKRRFGRFSPHTARPAALSVRHDGGSGHHRKDAPVHVSALLEFDAVPLETEDEVTVLLDITAPVRAAQEERPPSTLQVVLDRSSSMSRDDRLGGAVRALLSVVDRLDPVDRFGVVVFSDQARVLVPAGPLTDKAAVKERIRAVRPGGSTDLSSGLMRGVQEARRASQDGGATLLLISDGHANQGITEHGRLAEIARSAYVSGVSVTTIGYRLGYDEALLGAVADGGAGDALFAEDADTAVGLIQGEADHLLAKTAQAASVRIRPEPVVGAVGLLGGLPADRLPGGEVMVELGDFYSGEPRRLLVRLEIPGIPRLGPATVASLEVTYVDPGTLESFTVTLPVPVNVVPGSEAAGRVADPAVSTEKAYQRAQEAKHTASEALRRGDRE